MLLSLFAVKDKDFSFLVLSIKFVLCMAEIMQRLVGEGVFRDFFAGQCMY
jgi:hypothetical protein